MENQRFCAKRAFQGNSRNHRNHGNRPNSHPSVSFCPPGPPGGALGAPREAQNRVKKTNGKSTFRAKRAFHGNIDSPGITGIKRAGSRGSRDSRCSTWGWAWLVSRAEPNWRRWNVSWNASPRLRRRSLVLVAHLLHPLIHQQTCRLCSVVCRVPACRTGKWATASWSLCP